MVSPRLFACLWLPSIGAGKALSQGAKFEVLQVLKVLVASLDDEMPSPYSDASLSYSVALSILSILLTSCFGAVSGASPSVLIMVFILVATQDGSGQRLGVGRSVGSALLMVCLVVPVYQAALFIGFVIMAVLNLERGTSAKKPGKNLGKLAFLS